MRMMRVPECVAAIGSESITAGRVYYGIRAGVYKSARVGGVLVVDCDQVARDVMKYEPRKSRPDGLRCFARMLTETGLTRRMAENGVRDGWIKPVIIKRRKWYDVEAIRDEIARMLEDGGR